MTLKAQPKEREEGGACDVRIHNSKNTFDRDSWYIVPNPLAFLSGESQTCLLLC